MDEHMFRKEFLDERSEEESLLTESDSAKSLTNSESEKEEEPKYTGKSSIQASLPEDEPIEEVINKVDKLPNKKILSQVLKNAESEADRITFGEEQREKIIHTASVFRKERDLKVVSKYWKRWKCII